MGDVRKGKMCVEGKEGKEGRKVEEQSRARHAHLQVIRDKQPAEEVHEEGGYHAVVVSFCKTLLRRNREGNGGASRTDAEAEEAEQRDGVRAEAPAEVALARLLRLLLLLHCGAVEVCLRMEVGIWEDW